MHSEPTTQNPNPKSLTWPGLANHHRRNILPIAVKDTQKPKTVTLFHTLVSQQKDEGKKSKEEKKKKRKGDRKVKIGPEFYFGKFALGKSFLHAFC